MKDKRQVILEAVRRAKKSGFGVTAIKVELEANLDRNWDGEECHSYMMERLADLGLAQQRDYSDYLSHEEFETNWYPEGALKYAEFYNDGSVDSEFTFTIMLDNEENIFLLEKVIGIWKGLCQEAGEEIDVSGAGMHMAFLNSREGEYPTICVNAQFPCFSNFQRSMGLLIPALYFLGSSNKQSRGTGYRRPGVEIDSHRSAIDWRNGALEFRVFDTCYDNPSAILDNVVVMSKCLRYWSDTFVPSGLDKVTRTVSFGNDRGYELSRFYTTHTHLDLLNQGLVRLKPSYYTIGEIKKQRGFSKTKNKLNGERTKQTKMARAEYKEYEERFEWMLKVEHSRYKARRFQEAAEIPSLRTMNEEQLEQEAKAFAEDWERSNKRPLSSYIRDRITEYEHSLRGEYTLRA